MDYQAYQHLVIEVADGIALVRLNRPEKLNAFNAAMGRELLRLPDQLRDDPAVRVVVVTGTGRGFCSGVDISEARGPTADNPFHRQPMDPLGYSGRLPLAWHEIDKPTIAAVNGVAAGGGLCLAMMMDMRVIARTARLLPMFITRGLAPEVGASWFAARLLGLPRALEWYLTGEEISGERAGEIGLANYVVEESELLPKAMELARKIADGPPIAVRLTRRSIYHAVTSSLRDHLPYEASNLAISQATEDAAEGRAAVRERRKPVFVGR
ncbi:MAG: enoyl-CoA hydratase/isomerase family protein [Chloroflexota bacterium]|nr:enoyl-CoA hydratase/isomerase family protein [Dehalococcoidia bacterium]MDW8253790.1 enoyl-CoA hydratase/isomerase family protein [Chloroflexota bacterium]